MVIHLIILFPLLLLQACSDPPDPGNEVHSETAEMTCGIEAFAVSTHGFSATTDQDGTRRKAVALQSDCGAGWGGVGSCADGQGVFTNRRSG